MLSVDNLYGDFFDSEITSDLESETSESTSDIYLVKDRFLLIAHDHCQCKKKVKKNYITYLDSIYICLFSFATGDSLKKLN